LLSNHILFLNRANEFGIIGYKNRKIFNDPRMDELLTLLLRVNSQLNKRKHSVKFKKRKLILEKKRLLNNWYKQTNFNPNWIDFSTKEAIALTNYIRGVYFILDCKKAVARISKEVWEGIEDRMLRVPETSIKSDL
ncbi:MAG: hypothetical protein AAGA60_33085, partial [Cyanobacteria bacterium P01_E01_bin.42]